MRFTTRMIAALVALLLHISAPAHAQIPCKYDVEIIPHVDCGIIGQGPMVLSAINNHGEVIGWATGCGDPGHYRSYTWNGGPTLTQLPIPPGGAIGFRATDLNDNNIICGFADYTNGQHRAWVYNRTTNVWTQIPPVNTQIGWSSAAALNNAGLVVGYRGIGNDEQGRPWNAFIFDLNTGVITDLGVMNGPNSGAYAISENGSVVGWCGTSGFSLYQDSRAFIHKDAATTVLGSVPDGLSSVAVGVNNQQVLVQGLTQVSPNIYRSFLFSNDEWSELSVPTGFDRTFGISLSDSGIVVGAVSNSNDQSGMFYGYAWFGNTALNLTNSISAPNISADGAHDINDAGQIISEGRISGQPANLRLVPRPVLMGDVTCDEIVNVLDLLAVINNWGPCSACSADADSNGVVNHWDLIIVVQNWGNSS